MANLGHFDGGTILIPLSTVIGPKCCVSRTVESVYGLLLETEELHEPNPTVHYLVRDDLIGQSIEGKKRDISLLQEPPQPQPAPPSNWHRVSNAYG